MKTRMVVAILILILSVLVVIGSCATRKKAISDEDFFNVWGGTWINTDYVGGDTGQKIINHPDGTREGFTLLTNTIAGHIQKITILDQWVDSKGTIWYRGHFEFYFTHLFTGYEMGKISDSGNTLEYIWASEDYPIEEWNPDDIRYTYRIYYRQ